MLFSLTLTKPNASDLGYLLHKNPNRFHEFELSSGKAFVFFPEVSDSKSTAILMLELDPIRLARGTGNREHQNKPLYQYVNDRPYVPSSFLSSALTKVFGTALSGRCKEKPELAETVLKFEINLPSLPCRGGEQFLRSVFEPLEYEVIAREIALDEEFPTWGRSRYYNVTLRKDGILKDLLSHLYVLLPALDDDKHFWVGKTDVELLLKRGEGWLDSHPRKNEISQRFLRNQKSLARLALEQLIEDEDSELEVCEHQQEQSELTIEKKISLNSERLQIVKGVLEESPIKTVMDLGCGEGKLLSQLLNSPKFSKILGMDVSSRSLEIAARRLKLEMLPDRKKEKIELIQGSLIYRDERIRGFDAAAIIEVIEHMDLNRLAAFERVVFEYARPQLVIITTPNVEYNRNFATLAAGSLRHEDHRFEWTRQEFEDWSNRICSRNNYTVTFKGIGEADPELGSPTQMGVFRIED